MGDGVNRRKKALEHIIEPIKCAIIRTAKDGSTSYSTSHYSEFWTGVFIQEVYAEIRKEFPEIYIKQDAGGSNPDVRYFTFSWE